jgi:hypothetical protein
MCMCLEVIVMRKQAVIKKKTLRRTLIAVGGTMIAALWLFAIPASAGPKHKPKHKHHHGHHVKVKRPMHYNRHILPPPRVLRAPRRVVVPTTMHRGQVEAYRPYFAGRAYHRQHGHDHAVYYFPVYRDDRYVHEPHYYCEGQRVRTSHVAYHGDNVSFRIAF